MDEPIRVETGMNYEDFKRFSWFNVLRRGRGLRPAFIVMLAALALSVAAFILLLAVEGFAGFLESTGVTVLIVLLIFPFYFGMLTLMFRLIYKRSENVLSAVHRYEFSADALRVESTGGTLSGTTEARYENLHRAYETRDDFYIYVNKVQAFLLAKRYFDGREDELAALLREKMGKNYIRCF